MKFVVDASIGFKWALIEQDSDKARKLRDDYRQAVHELLAPDVFPIEVTHALTRAERQARITQQQGAQFLRDILNTLPLLHSSLVLLPRAYAISSQVRIGVYDCLYVALAEREQCELVTADGSSHQRAAAAVPLHRELVGFLLNPFLVRRLRKLTVLRVAATVQKAVRGEATMNFSLTPDLERFVQDKVHSGVYHSTSAVVCEALRLLQEKELSHQSRLERLKEEISFGIEQADRGDVAPLDVEVIKAKGREQVAEQRKQSD